MLTLKDNDFTSFLNVDSAIIKSFIYNLSLFWSDAGMANSSLHVKFFKFLLRLCPAYNSRGLAENPRAPKAVIAPKRFIDALFEPDPVGLITYLFVTWHSSAPELLLIIRSELFPQALVERLKQCAHKKQHPNTVEFLEWVCGTKISVSDLTFRERESILKRFEYESDDDLVDEGEAVDSESNTTKLFFDPIQKILFESYISDPSVFSRTSSCRQSKSRQTLCNLTKLSHEQIEGWALMLERNPKKMRILQDFIIANGNLNK